MAPARILLPVVIFISSCGFAVGQQGQRNAAAPFSVGGTINSAPQGSSGAGGLGLEHFQVASDLKQALSLRVPQDFLRDHLGDYHFKNPNILLKALLHPTYKTRDRKDRKDRHDSFEPLDYVGSFVMDYIVSRYVLMHARNKSQHHMAEVKASVLRQDSLAYFAVKNNFHKFVFVDRPVEKASLREFADGLRNVQTLGELRFAKKKRSFVYKFFKSVIGAIYVDSDYNADTVEPILLKMIKRDLDLIL
uniref:Putative secreted protein n=1 Tax=Amblyomma triste TaxID=251400 RepID=A0A023GEF7_AMBTT